MAMGEIQRFEELIKHSFYWRFFLSYNTHGRVPLFPVYIKDRGGRLFKNIKSRCNRPLAGRCSKPSQIAHDMRNHVTALKNMIKEEKQKAT